MKTLAMKVSAERIGRASGDRQPTVARELAPLLYIRTSEWYELPTSIGSGQGQLHRRQATTVRPVIVVR